MKGMNIVSCLDGIVYTHTDLNPSIHSKQTNCRFFWVR